MKISLGRFWPVRDAKIILTLILESKEYESFWEWYWTWQDDLRLKGSGSLNLESKHLTQELALEIIKREAQIDSNSVCFSEKVVQNWDLIWNLWAMQYWNFDPSQT